MSDREIIRLALDYGPTFITAVGSGNDCRLRSIGHQTSVDLSLQGNVMNHHSPRYPDAGRKASKSTLKGLCATLAITLLAAPLSACNDGSATAVQRATFVRTEIVQPRARQAFCDADRRGAGSFQRRPVISGQRARARAAGRRWSPRQSRRSAGPARRGRAAGRSGCGERGGDGGGGAVARGESDVRSAEPSHCQGFHDACGCSIRRRKDCELQKARSKPRTRGWARPKMRLAIPNCAPVQRV